MSRAIGVSKEFRWCCNVALSMKGELVEPNKTILKRYVISLLSGSDGVDNQCSLGPLHQVVHVRRPFLNL